MKNLLDSAISYVSPQWAAERARLRLMAASFSTAFSGASITRRNLQSWLPTKGSANADYSAGEQDILTSRCRDAYRNQPLAAAVIGRMKHCVIGSGLSLQSHVDWSNLGITQDEATEKENLIEREWEHFAKHCDAERIYHLNKLQALSLVSTLISGDVFINTPFIERPECEYGLKLQVIEADRVCNPNFGMDTSTMRRGVELDSVGAPVAYHVMTQHPGDDVIAEYKWQRVPAFGGKTGQRRIFHIFEKDRPGQVRGIPMLAPIIEPLKGLDRYTDAEITAAVISSLYTVFIQSETAQMGPQTTETTTGATLDDDQIALGPGAVVSLLPGEKIETSNPGRPNTAYDPFVTSVYRQIGAAIGIPADFLTLAFTASYSAARAAMLQAWQLIKYWRSLMVEQFLQPAFELWFDEFVARGKLGNVNYDAMTKYYWTRAIWIGPARGAIDENKEVQAARDRIELGISTRQIEAEELLGADWIDIQKQLAREKREMGNVVPVQNPAQQIQSAEQIDSQDKQEIAKAVNQ